MSNSIQHERNRWATMTAAQLETRLGRIRDPVKLMHFATLAWESGIDELIELVRLKGESLGIPLPRPLTAKKEEKEIKTILEKAKVDNKKFGGNLNRDGQPRRRLKRL